MSILEGYFRQKIDETYDHPLLRFIDGAAKQSDVKRVAVEVLRPRDTLGFKPAKLYLHLLDDSGQDVQPYQTEDWDDLLNSALVKRGIRAITPENEKVRFSLGLRAALQVPEIRFGDGYYNSVLVHYITNGPFAQHPAVESVLKHVYRSPVAESSKSFGECRDQIDTTIRGRAMELVECLKYEISEAEEILATAVAQYLDERFSVTNRRMMGLL